LFTCTLRGKCFVANHAFGIRVVLVHDIRNDRQIRADDDVDARADIMHLGTRRVLFENKPLGAWIRPAGQSAE
jgi:hypothetical protein